MAASRITGMCYNKSLSVFSFAVSVPARRNGGIWTGQLQFDCRGNADLPERGVNILTKLLVAPCRECPALCRLNMG